MADEETPTAFKKGRGRPSKLTEELSKSICNAIIVGNYVETAAALFDISKVTLYKWLKRGNRQKSGIYRDFVNAVQRAMAQAEARDLQVIDRVAAGTREKTGPDGQPQLVKVEPNWKAAAWRLERKHSERWGRREQVQAVAPEERGTDGAHGEILNLIDSLERKEEDYGETGTEE